MKPCFLTLFLLFSFLNAMDITNYLTPHKRPVPVLAPSGVSGTYNSRAVDCPFVFRHNGRFFMLHIGFDGTGYQTALAVSDDLLHWQPYATVLKRLAPGRWDSGNAAGIWIVRASDTLEEVPELKKINGKYWMLYHSYPGEGYENGPAQMSFATCEDEDLREWKRLDSPVLSWKDGNEWEHGGLYKGAVVSWQGRYYMLYNAKNVGGGYWREQTGLVVSDDLLTWKRIVDQPVIAVRPGKWDSRFVSDPCPVFDNGQWLNFFFGYDSRHAQDGLAWSKDLVHWERHDEPIVKSGEPGSADETHAHKASVVRHNGVLYHFYCGVRPAREGDATYTGKGGEFRAIYVATSQPLGKD